MSRSAAVALALSLVSAFPSQAQVEPVPSTRVPSPVGAQAPGYYRLFVGRFEVTALLDGTHPFPSDKVAVGATTAEVKQALQDAFLPVRYEGMINAFLINMDGRLVLVDAGAGNLYGTEGGGLKGAIQAAGYAPEQVTDVFVTHLHEDHVGGLVLNGRPLFPNATIHVPRKDADFWLDDRNQANVDELLKPFFPAVQGVLAPYRRAKRVAPFDGQVALLPGLSSIAAPGHTPGHTVYLLQDAGQTLLFWGDTVHMAPVQFPRPAVAIRYDWNVPLAVASRERLMERAVTGGWLVAGAHISFPGIGHVRRVSAKGGYRWFPVNYTLNRGRP